MASVDLNLRFDSEKFQRDVRKAINRAIAETLSNITNYLHAEDPQPLRCIQLCPSAARHPESYLFQRGLHQCTDEAGHAGHCTFTCRNGVGGIAEPPAPPANVRFKKGA